MELIVGQENIKMCRNRWEIRVNQEKSFSPDNSSKKLTFLFAVRYIWHYVLHSQGVRRGEQLLLEGGAQVKDENSFCKRSVNSRQGKRIS